MASSQKSAAKQQVKLWIELKEKVDLVYKQLNQYRGACRSVDRLNRAVRRFDDQLDPDRMLAEFVKFEQDYRVSRKKIRKLDRQLLAFNLYDKLYDLYEGLVMEESIGTGGDLIDSSAIDKEVVDEVGCNAIEDTSVDDFAGISIDFNPEDCLEIQLDTIQPKISNTSIDSSSFPKTDVSVSAQVNSFEFQCPQCDKLFKTSSAYSIHKRTHESEPRFKCNWEGCDYRTYRSDFLKKHKTVHSDDRPIRCPQCDKSFKTPSVLRNHKRIHESEPQFKCSWKGCDYGTNRIDNLKVHETVHSDERPFQCPQCDKSFKTSDKLNIHQRVHSSEPRFKCSWEGCDFGTHRNEHFKAHQTVHTGKPLFKCNWEGCGFRTHRNDNLKAHQTVHSDERPFQCSQCDKSFKYSTGLSSHKRIHESEPRFKCKWEGCDFRTHRSDNLKAHQSTHSDERPFQCPQCDKSFKYSTGLNSHKRTHES